MTAELTLDMKWVAAVPLLLEVYANAETPKARADARNELLRCARVADSVSRLQCDLYDSHAAAEGWAIFDADGSTQNRLGNCPLQIQRLDELNLLDSDLEAHKTVVEGAKDGKEHCLHALKRLRRESKPELAIVLTNAMGQQWPEDMLLRVNDEQLDALETLAFTKVVTRPTPSPEPAGA